MTEAARHSGLSATLGREIDWLQQRIDFRLQQYLQQSGHDPAAAPPPPPELVDRCAYGATVAMAGLGTDDRLALILALARWLRPQALDLFFCRNANLDRRFTEFGGIDCPDSGGFVPTRQTALFLIAGDDLDRRLAVLPMFGPDAPLVRVRLIAAQSDELAPWAVLEPHPDLIARLFRYPG